ncbi:MAG: hypothetical protein U9N77_06270 [Thermodesulfobacteriota bacterium]|nr:hypothetical protein [Thermodesulfobacteriota bacterium]
MVFCLHYQHDDRERGSFYRMDVIKIIQMVSSRLSPDASTVVLHALKRRWYEQPKRKYDFESWHGIIKTLTCEPNVSEKKRIAIIEQLVQNLIPALFTKIEMPPCKIIKNERASWQGMTTCIPLRTRTKIT